MATNLNLAFYISVGFCVGLVILVGILYGVISDGNKTSDQVTRLYGIVLTFSYIASIITGVIGFYWFNNNPAYMIQFLLFLTLLLVPMALTSVAVSTAQLATLRNTLAAGGQVGAVVA